MTDQNEAPTIDRVRQISAVLKVPDTDNATARAEAAGVTVVALPAYLKKLTALGLMDNHGRVTRAGVAYSVIAELGAGKGASDAAVWRATGGSRDNLNNAIEVLTNAGLVERGEVRTQPTVDANQEAYWAQRKADGHEDPAPLEEGEGSVGWVAKPFDFAE